MHQKLREKKRRKFYEATGALGDMVSNHVFTLLSMVAIYGDFEGTIRRRLDAQQQHKRANGGLRFADGRFGAVGNR
jgi:glucose-6-phosphate 1-dehydrogenase